MPRALKPAVFLSAALAVAAAGCSPGVAKVTGVVSYKDKPLAKAQVDFIPTEGGPTATAMTGDDGRYELEIEPGACKVTVLFIEQSDEERHKVLKPTPGSPPPPPPKKAKGKDKPKFPP